MPDKTNNEPLKPAENIPSGPVPEPNAAAAEPTPEPSTLNPQPSTMEVHHHAHGAHGKKTWKSYFWEFLMLFLAVFCGFLAEYQLEHKIEHDRGKQYIRSFYEDLVADSARFSSLLINFTNKVDVLEDMSPCYDSLLSNQLSKNCLAGIMQQTAGFPDLTYT